MVDRSALDRIIASGGYIDVRTGSAPNANNIARNSGALPFNPFAGYINSPESVDRGYLTECEIQTLMETPVKSGTCELVRDLFIFSVFTGLEPVGRQRLHVRVCQSGEHREVQGEMCIRDRSLTDRQSPCCQG